MAWQWNNNYVSRVTAYNETVPNLKHSFDGVNASASALGKSLDPEAIARGISRFTFLVAGFSVTPNDITRSIKQEGVES